MQRSFRPVTVCLCHWTREFAHPPVSATETRTLSYQEPHKWGDLTTTDVGQWWVVHFIVKLLYCLRSFVWGGWGQSRALNYCEAHPSQRRGWSTSRDTSQLFSLVITCKAQCLYKLWFILILQMGTDANQKTKICSFSSFCTVVASGAPNCLLLGEFLLVHSWIMV